ncbi:MAG TPA: exopolysaccharide biosynthesis polyprenyl glycosylphosphotransferase [Acidocella sp.]|nr:exopolysaccharide biosynthesis polyprenyl glycosylphosphotransferase [Acidocella sp.]
MVEVRAGGPPQAEFCFNSQPYVEDSAPQAGQAWLLPLADILAIMALPLLGALLRQEDETFSRYLLFWAVLALCAVGLTASHGGYAPGRRWGRGGTAAICFLATGVALLGLAVLLNHSGILLRRWTLPDLAATPVLLLSMRAVQPARAAAAAPSNPGGTLVVCYDRCPGDLGQALAQQQLPARIAGVLYLAALREAGGWPELRDAAELLHSLAVQPVQNVVFVHHPALDAFGTAPHRELLQELLAYPARIWLAFDLSANLPDMLRARTGGCKLVPVATDDLITSRHAVKRGFDILVASLLLHLCTPLLVLLALLVRLSGPGPVVFRQNRIGAQGRPFTVLKFRTMRHEPGSAFAQAKPEDARVTRIGRFLRRTSLDELLQLINVICGEMSLVGPRPHAPETTVEGISFESALKLYRLRHRVKPGITGLAQVRGQRGETRHLPALERRLASDLEYIQTWSVGLDMLILLRTLPVLLGHANAG